MFTVIVRITKQTLSIWAIFDILFADIVTVLVTELATHLKITTNAGFITSANSCILRTNFFETWIESTIIFRIATNPIAIWASIKISGAYINARRKFAVVVRIPFLIKPTRTASFVVRTLLAARREFTVVVGIAVYDATVGALLDIESACLLAWEKFTVIVWIASHTFETGTTTLGIKRTRAREEFAIIVNITSDIWSESALFLVRRTAVCSVHAWEEVAIIGWIAAYVVNTR
mmetsp:Transcript_16858/g.24949  ORF Transcript_16858/g.24949 Transcript_16858/m.24949 type:complete len:233 (-) Transcript_16858:1769-2467(-)